MSKVIATAKPVQSGPIRAAAGRPLCRDSRPEGNHCPIPPLAPRAELARRRTHRRTRQKSWHQPGIFRTFAANFDLANPIFFNTASWR